MKPRNANTPQALMKLSRDNVERECFAFLVGETHVRVEDQVGNYISVPKRVFNRFVDFYEKEQP